MCTLVSLIHRHVKNINFGSADTVYAYVCLIELSVKYKFSVKKYEHKM